jgi:hypothetical protein
MRMRIAALALLALISMRSEAIPIAAGDSFRLDYNFSGTGVPAPLHTFVMQLTFFSTDLLNAGEGFHWQVFDSSNALLGGAAYANTLGGNYGSVVQQTFATTNDLIGHILVTWDAGSVDLWHSSEFWDPFKPQYVSAAHISPTGQYTYRTLALDATPATAVSEPAGVALFGFGLLALALARRVRREGSVSRASA